MALCFQHSSCWHVMFPRSCLSFSWHQAALGPFHWFLTDNENLDQTGRHDSRDSCLLYGPCSCFPARSMQKVSSPRNNAQAYRRLLQKSKANGQLPLKVILRKMRAASSLSVFTCFNYRGFRESATLVGVNTLFHLVNQFYGSPFCKF